jgi:hypothetical protein
MPKLYTKGMYKRKKRERKRTSQKLKYKSNARTSRQN